MMFIMQLCKLIS